MLGNFYLCPHCRLRRSRGMTINGLGACGICQKKVDDAIRKMKETQRLALLEPLLLLTTPKPILMALISDYHRYD